jgi:uncharacterized protein
MSISEIPIPRIEEFCRKWNIVELTLFGSILRDDFGPDSDVDVLVTLAKDTQINLYDWLDMEDELTEIFRQHIDLVVKSGLRNPFRKYEILRTARVIYAAGA